MMKFMAVHKEPELNWAIVEENWTKLVQVESAKWVKTYYNQKEGVRFCVWLAPDMETLKKTFSDMDVSLESMYEVEETRPDIWVKRSGRNISKQKQQRIHWATNLYPAWKDIP